MKSTPGDYRLVVPADLEQLAVVRRFAESAGQSLGGDPETIGDLVLALNEAVTNIIVHGYQGGPGAINVRMTRRQGRLNVTLRDDAPPFDPTSVSEPVLDRPLEKRRPGGLGVLMMRRLVDELRHTVSATGGNVLTLIKTL